MPILAKFGRFWAKIANICTLKFGPSAQNLVGLFGPPKTLPTLTMDLVPAGVTEKQPLLRFAEKQNTGQKAIFSLQKTPEIGKKTDIHLGKGYFFLRTTLPGRG